VVRPWVSNLQDVQTVVTPDVRGRGRSICRDPSLHSWQQYALDVVSILDLLSLDRAVVGGVSLGAGIALATALRNPGRVDALILHSNVYAGETTGWLPSQKEAQEGVFEKAQQIADGEVLAEAKWQRHDSESIAAAISGLGWTQPFLDEKELANIECPALVLPGADAMHLPEVSQMYLERIPNSRTVDPVPTDPEATATAFREFLAELD
jgi:3-oxoadipate enol-lactonase